MSSSQRDCLYWFVHVCVLPTTGGNKPTHNCVHQNRVDGYQTDLNQPLQNGHVTRVLALVVPADLIADQMPKPTKTKLELDSWCATNLLELQCKGKS